MADHATIAICEDDPDIRELLAAYLKANGFEVATGGSAAALDKILAERSVALIILDWMLPGENGLSACRRLRASGGPPIIMLTARDEDCDRVAGLDGGADTTSPSPSTRASFYLGSTPCCGAQGKPEPSTF